MFSAWPVHGEGESKKVDVTVAHRKVLLADAEHTTNLQKILGNCKIILFYWCYSFHQSDQSWQVPVKRFPKFRNSKETSAGLQMERWERERPLQSKMYVKPVRGTRDAFKLKWTWRLCEIWRNLSTGPLLPRAGPAKKYFSSSNNLILFCVRVIWRSEQLRMCWLPQMWWCAPSVHRSSCVGLGRGSCATPSSSK